jgi:hypothetical protein
MISMTAKTRCSTPASCTPPNIAITPDAHG